MNNQVLENKIHCFGVLFYCKYAFLILKIKFVTTKTYKFLLDGHWSKIFPSPLNEHCFNDKYLVVCNHVVLPYLKQDKGLENCIKL